MRLVRHLMRHFGFSIAGSLAIFAVMAWYGGLDALLVTVMLAGIEVAFSFDNAVVNAKTLTRMSMFWQRAFLSVGIIIAIFGMRLVFPIMIVAITAHASWLHVVDLALHHPEVYAQQLEHAHPAISAFGGAFLLTLVLYFFIDGQRQRLWIVPIERHLQKLSHWAVPPLLALVAIGFLAWLPANPHVRDTLEAGLAGIAVYAAIRAFIYLIGRTAGDDGNTPRVGLAALTMFIYLELLDASFSFDGVIGAFAITNKVVLITAGLGIGAVWVRSLTVYMVRRGTLDSYEYLEHGAHYAITLLAISMLVSLIWEVPSILTGLGGITIIVIALLASHRLNQSAQRSVATVAAEEPDK